MKLHRKRDLKKCGIYCIQNKVNNKVYIGKSSNIYERLKQHKTSLNRKVLQQENQHLVRAWHKYGEQNFEYIVLEYIDNTIDGYEKTLAEQELYWMKIYNSLKSGYNIRYDSRTNTKVNSLTRKQQSDNLKRRWKENRSSMIEMIKNNWKQKSQEELESMKDTLSKSRSRYYFIGKPKDKTCSIVKVYNTMRELLKANPTYKRHNIYAVCSGEKPSMYGYIWSKIHKEDIVQS